MHKSIVNLDRALHIVPDIALAYVRAFAPCRRLETWTLSHAAPAQEVSASAQKVSASAQEVSASAQEVPTSAQTVSASTEIVPVSTETVPASAETVSASTESLMAITQYRVQHQADAAADRGVTRPMVR